MSNCTKVLFVIYIRGIVRDYTYVFPDQNVLFRHLYLRYFQCIHIHCIKDGVQCFVQLGLLLDFQMSDLCDTTCIRKI